MYMELWKSFVIGRPSCSYHLLSIYQTHAAADAVHNREANTRVRLKSVNSEDCIVTDAQQCDDFKHATNMSAAMNDDVLID